MKGKHHHSEKNIGKIIHEILSEVETDKDISKACEHAFIEGKIDKDERKQIEHSMNENLRLETVKHWFDGTYKILNERDLIAQNKLLRPDRIMYTGSQAIVVDYKTGEQIPDKYNRQVERYAHKLKEAGFAVVEGYLWYLANNEVVKVCEL